MGFDIACREISKTMAYSMTNFLAPRGVAHLTVLYNRDCTKDLCPSHETNVMRCSVSGSVGQQHGSTNGTKERR